MLDRMTVADFEGHLNASFPIQLDSGERLDLELIEAKALGQPRESRPELRTQPFSLIFRGPFDRVLAQGIYQVKHPTHGSLGIFLVLLGPQGDPQGMHYQAIFN